MFRWSSTHSDSGDFVMAARLNYYLQTIGQVKCIAGQYRKSFGVPANHWAGIAPAYGPVISYLFLLFLLFLLVGPFLWPYRCQMVRKADIMYRVTK